jgi:P-type Ca2+ transporter type 2C
MVRTSKGMSTDQSKNQAGFAGLSDAEVVEARTRYGRNTFDEQKMNPFIRAVKDVFQEPMFLLLLLASGIYFFIGETGDALFLVAAVFLVAAISIYQDSRSRNALAALRSLTRPQAKVYRNGLLTEVPGEDIVMGDSIMVEEGSVVPADGEILRANDFYINESILTGESLAVYKNEEAANNKVFQGTQVTGGLAICMVTAVGSHTQLGRIGKSLESIDEEPTPLQLQISTFVKQMAIAGLIVFLLVWAINFFQTWDFPQSLLQALTLAMSILPEEIPVAFTTFMALGAWRMMKQGVIVKQTRTVEALGSATVICVDKTGTITENRMMLTKIYVPEKKCIVNIEDIISEEEKEVIEYGMWSSEPIPFDPMEVALHEAYTRFAIQDKRKEYQMVHEYPLSGKPPMMTHIFQHQNGQRVIAAKGAPEAIMAVSRITDDDRQKIIRAVHELSREGYRVLGVAEADFQGDSYPPAQQEFSFVFRGLLAFYDPPKNNMPAVLESFYKAGIDVKIITGDNAETTATIAQQVGFQYTENSLTGDELLGMSEEQLTKQVMNTHIFTRMFPEAKLRILNALKAAGQIVAMTGDGVNDGPALKAAHIGIAMGKKGSEIAKQASSLILTDDDLGRMVEAIAMGRRIYTNLKKAIQYIISIHIPIILTVFLPLVLGWVYPAIFSPVHIIFLELIMGPTCSIIYENEPMELNTMIQKPRPFITTFFKWDELSTSILQGLAITAGVLSIYQYAAINGETESVTRTMVFATLITANIFLTLVNRSFYYSILTTIRYPNALVPLMIGITVLLSALIIYVDPFTGFFAFDHLTLSQLSLSIAAGFISVIWYEVVKVWKRIRQSD